MIIPVRCFTCGKVIANKWKYFDKKRTEIAEKAARETATPETVDDDSLRYFDNVLLKELLDEIGITKLCCRRHMLSHTDVLQHI